VPKGWSGKCRHGAVPHLRDPAAPERRGNQDPSARTRRLGMAPSAVPAAMTNEQQRKANVRLALIWRRSRSSSFSAPSPRALFRLTRCRSRRRTRRELVATPSHGQQARPSPC
jgi:hypothetical protein